MQSQVSFAATAGTTYRIQVGGFNGAAGDLVLNVSSNPGPPPARAAKASKLPPRPPTPGGLSPKLPGPAAPPAPPGRRP